MFSSDDVCSCTITGVIAGDKKIPKGSHLGIYAGELLTEQEAEARGRYARLPDKEPHIY